MKMQKSFAKAALLSAMLASGAASATTLDLPEPNEMSAGLYHDFLVYSFDLLEQCADAMDPRCLPSGPLPVQSGPGQIKDDVVIISGADGKLVHNVPNPLGAGAAADDNFLSPSGEQGDTFDMIAKNAVNNDGDLGEEPGGTFTGDQNGTWEISVGLLKTWLANSNLVFLFDNNQDGTADGQTLLIWGQASIIDVNGNQATGQCYEVSNRAGTGCGGAPASINDYLPVVGDFCVDKVTGISYGYGLVGNDGDCAAGEFGNTNGGYYVSNNLSTSIAEFGAYNADLEAAIKSGDYDDHFLSVNIKYIANDAGFEQLFICADCDIDERKVPEPAALGLLGIGLLGMYAASHRRRAK